jgi:hypothetical protein
MPSVSAIFRRAASSALIVSLGVLVVIFEPRIVDPRTIVSVPVLLLPLKSIIYSTNKKPTTT